MSNIVITKGKLQKPPRILLYGTPGIGKSSFAAEAPNVVFLDTEDSTSEMDVERLPKPNTLKEATDSIRFLLESDHGYKTLAIDTWDWFEPVIWRHVASSYPGGDGKSIEGFGYGKGYVFATDELRGVLALLESVQQRGIMIVSLAHGAIRTFENPEGANYDRYDLKMHKSSSGVLREWHDCVLFANYETFAAKEKPKDRKAKAIGEGRRLLYTSERPAYHAKNRFGLPHELELSWQVFWNHARGAQAEKASDVAARIMSRFDGALKVQAENGIKKFGNDLRKLRAFENYLASKLEELENGTSSNS